MIEITDPAAAALRYGLVEHILYTDGTVESRIIARVITELDAIILRTALNESPRRVENMTYDYTTITAD